MNISSINNTNFNGYLIIGKGRGNRSSINTDNIEEVRKINNNWTELTYLGEKDPNSMYIPTQYTQILCPFDTVLKAYSNCKDSELTIDLNAERMDTLQPSFNFMYGYNKQLLAEGRF